MAAVSSFPRDARDGRPRRRVALAAIAGVLGLALAPAAGAQAPVVFERSKLRIATASGEIAFDVELALTDEQRARGLMFRDSMGAYEGMLFDFGPPQPVSMWMKNTRLPLDMLFIAADGRIVRIAANTEPFSTRTIESGGLVKGVLELNGGAARLLGIRPGDRVLHPIFGTGS